MLVKMTIYLFIYSFYSYMLYIVIKMIFKSIFLFIETKLE